MALLAILLLLVLQVLELLLHPRWYLRLRRRLVVHSVLRLKQTKVEMVLIKERKRL